MSAALHLRVISLCGHWGRDCVVLIGRTNSRNTNTSRPIKADCAASQTPRDTSRDQDEQSQRTLWSVTLRSGEKIILFHLHVCGNCQTCHWEWQREWPHWIITQGAECPQRNCRHHSISERICTWLKTNGRLTMHRAFGKRIALSGNQCSLLRQTAAVRIVRGLFLHSVSPVRTNEKQCRSCPLWKQPVTSDWISASVWPLTLWPFHTSLPRTSPQLVHHVSD